MKVAYITTYDPTDISGWSGASINILKTLKSCGFQIETIGNLHDKCSLFTRMKKVIYSKLLSKHYLRDREPMVLKSYASQVEKALESIDYDIVFSPGTVPIAYLKTEKPIVFWTDATFAGMIDFYPSFSNLCAETIKDGNEMEQSALSKCSLAIYEGEWAANTATENYDVDPKKVKVVPFGANVHCDRKEQDIVNITNKKNFDTCKLLFIGAEWFRKGGDFAVKVADILNQRGVRTELHMVGDKPSTTLPGFVKHHGFISIKTDEGRSVLDKLMSESHFLILPTRADAVPIVFADASSFGLPSLTTRVGGTTEGIRDGKNGQTFPLDEHPEKYCDYIERLLASKEEYAALALSSFREYSERMNWASSGKQISRLLYDIVRQNNI